jgi:CelD/BcsL family acetyltransferase involved in cellulose biosynthesis
MHTVNPLEDCRWDDLVERHPRSSVFHTHGWLEALRRTYGYVPLVVTTSPPECPLRNGWPFCAIDSWLTGRRWVSLPFSDHCEPLSEDAEYEDQVFSGLEEVLGRDRLRYFETRPLQFADKHSHALPPSFLSSTRSYCFHHVDLSPDLQTLFRNCHKDSTQRKIQRAERERLGYEEGRSAALLDAFHKLQILTRRRHGLPPQPVKWFRNVAECLGGAVKIRVAYKDKQAIAAILTIRHKDTIVYKYGCSDTAHNNLGGMQMLFWKTIEEAKRDGLRRFDLGRSDLDNQGLITFKDRWGSIRSILCYSRITSVRRPKDVYDQNDHKTKERMMLGLFARMPEAIARTLGEVLYKHVG